jgi:hypothetical protein
MGGLEFFCLGPAVTGMPVGQLSESILAATRIAGGGERKRQVMNSNHSKCSIEANMGGKRTQEGQMIAAGGG